MGASAKQNQNPSQQQFVITKGSLVEVTSDEEGFGGAWFEATVIDPPNSPASKKKKKKTTPNHRNKAFVEYKTLCADDKLSVPLREHVGVSFIRPLPPLDGNSTAFELNDVVDALYKDGWWTGVITRVYEGPKFIVTFQNPPDEIEFGPSDLRFHLDWVSGTWVRPPKQKISGLMFSEGKKVEVALENEHYQDVWFPATIIEAYGDNTFLVEYQTHDENNCEAELQKVSVDSSRVRPSPPHLKNNNFVLLEKVEAFYEFGWWSGVITQVLADDRYTVFFKKTNIKRDFDHKEIRLHLNWKDGKWFTASQAAKFVDFFQDAIIPCQDNPGGLSHSDLKDTCVSTCISEVISVGQTQEQKALLSSNLTEIEPEDTSRDSLCTSKGTSEGKILEQKTPLTWNLKENHSEQLDLSNEKSLSVGSSLMKGARSVKISLHPVEKQGSDAGVLSPPSFEQNAVMSERPSEGTNFGIDNSTSNISGVNLLKDLTSGDQASDNPFCGMRIQRKRKKIVEQENHKPSPKKKPGRPGKEDIGIRYGAEVVEKDSRAKEADMAIILGLECCKLSGSRTGRTRQNHGEECLKLEEHQKQQLKDPPAHDRESQGGQSTQKRKRGRPRKVSVNSLNTAVTEQNGSVSKDEMFLRGSASEMDTPIISDSMLMSTVGSTPTFDSVAASSGKKLDSLSNPKIDSGSAPKISVARMTTENKDPASFTQHERQSSKRNKRRTTSASKNGQIQGETVESDTITKEVKMAIEQGHNMLDDQPLSKWFKGMHSPGVSTAMMADQSVELSKLGKEINKQTPNDESTVFMGEEVDTRGPAVANKSITLLRAPEVPFVKNTTLWTVVESMEVFRKMPQKPHFQPLLLCKESSREGFAIACMVNFSSAVEKISRLRFDDPKEKVDDILDSLTELEHHGFEVQGLRDCISELLSIKENHKKICEEVDDINKQVVLCNFDKADQDKEISELKEQIKKLEERVAQAESVKGVKDHEIAALESRRQELEETMRNARNNYEVLAAGVL